jgi:hypothetical protein
VVGALVGSASRIALRVVKALGMRWLSKPRTGTRAEVFGRRMGR